MAASAVPDPDRDEAREPVGALEDLLLLALKPFAPAGLVPLRIAAAGAPAELPLWAGTVSVAVAADPGWAGHEATRAVEAASLDLAGEHVGTRLWTGIGGRTALLAAGGTLEFPLSGRVAPNRARISLGRWGALDLAVPQTAGRLAAVALRLRAGGDYDLAMASLAVPTDGDRGLTGARIRAAADLAARLAEGDSAESIGSGVVDRIAGGRRTDPVLAPLVWSDATAVRRLSAEARLAAARLLVSRFPALLDGHVLMAAEGGRRLGVMLALATLEPARAWPKAEALYHTAMQSRLERPRMDAPDAALRTQPVTAAAVARLAAFALDAGRADHWAVDRRRRLRPGAVWNAVWTPPGRF